MYYVTIDDLKATLRDLAEILQIIALVMLIPIIVTGVYGNASNPAEFLKQIFAFLVPSLIFYILYRLFKQSGKTETVTQTKHAFLTVVVAWMLIALIGMLPFWIRGTLDPVDSFFESMSGWATTGMTMIETPEIVDKDILFYRSLTHLVGGVGIIALGLVVFLHTGKAASEYYGSEVGTQKIKPGIRGTVMETWKIYLLYAFTGVILYYLAGMPFFDSVNHSWAAIATGGFSVRTQSIGYYNSLLIEAITMLLMIAGAISFLVHYRLFNGDVKSLVSNIEAKYMFSLILFSMLLIWVNIYGSPVDFNSSSWFQSLRHSAFQTVSSITCTGFGTSSTGEWPHLSQTIMMMLMYFGGFYGSTAGGIKLLRLAVMAKAMHYVFKRMILPKNAVITLRIGGKNISNEEIIYVLGFSIIYLVVSVLGAIGLMWLGYTGYEGMELSLSAMGNVGIVFVTGSRWYGMHAAGKILLALLMWIGRLEVFPILLLFRPIKLGRKNHT
jgi:trk system potassium uptake protein TrkH